LAAGPNGAAVRAGRGGVSRRRQIDQRGPDQVPRFLVRVAVRRLGTRGQAPVFVRR